MALFDIFKKRKTYSHDDRLREKAKESARRKEEARKEISIDTEIRKEETSQQKFASNRASMILHSPVVTERSTLLAEHGAYVFRVAPRATKSEIKRAVEELYHVPVTDVRTLHTKPKQRRMRGIKGIKSGYKKAIITLEKGKKIEFV